MNHFKIVGAVLLLASAAFAAEPGAPAGGAAKGARIADFVRRNKIDPALGPRPASAPKKEKTFALTEDEFNAYIRWWIQAEARRGAHKEFSVKSAQVRFLPGRVVEADAVARISFASLGAMNALGDSELAQKVRRSLALDGPLHVRCRTGGAQGKAYLVVEELQIGGIRIPDALVREALKIIGAHQRPPRDFARPVPLPNGIRTFEILPQALTLSVAPI